MGRRGPPPNPTALAANVTVEIDAASNIKPSKKKSTERIDGIVASILAIGRAMLQTGPYQSVYSTRGVFWTDHTGSG